LNANDESRQVRAPLRWRFAAKRKYVSGTFIFARAS
jgi:hypothetical protein